jgi:hypothetical protein
VAGHARRRRAPRVPAGPIKPKAITDPWPTATYRSAVVRP